MVELHLILVMDRPENQTPIAHTPEGHEQSVSNCKGKQRNSKVSHYQGRVHHY